MKLFHFKTMEKWQKQKIITIFGSIVLIGMIFLAISVQTLLADKNWEKENWGMQLQSDPALQTEVDALSQNAIEVSTGTYVENLKEISLKGNYYRLVFLTWFKWEGDPELDMKNHFRVYKGYMNKQEVVKEYHENGLNYQLIRCDVTVTMNFWTRRFPLESHQIRVYMESQYPVDKVLLVEDRENSGINKNLSISGYNLARHDTAVINMKYDGTHGDPELTDSVITTEFVTAMELNRDGWGLYVKCFIALVGTTTWVLITLYINTYHRVDPLGMLPAALFGTVTNVMVGANLLPDALQLGLLEYVNFWGIFTILCVAVSVININRIRNKYEDKEFARSFGRLMFFTTLIMVLAGHLILPLSAYMRY